MYSCQQTGGPAKGKSNYSGRHHRISGNLLHRGGIDGNHIYIYIIHTNGEVSSVGTRSGLGALLYSIYTYIERLRGKVTSNVSTVPMVL